MVDIHSHILPGLDDGAQTLVDSLEILRLAAEHGTTDIVATPHANPRYTFDSEVVQKSLENLRGAVNGGPRIHYGCELHLTPENIEDAMRQPSRYTIGQRGYLLVEFSNQLVPKTSGEILRRLAQAGARPVIAHPERNPLLRQRMAELEQWVRQGCVLQITAQSLLGGFGESAQVAARTMVTQGLAQCIASDAHNCKNRPPALDEAYRQVADWCGARMAQQLFEENPRAILNGTPLPAGPMRSEKKPWYRFW